MKVLRFSKLLIVLVGSAFIAAGCGQGSGDSEDLAVPVEQAPGGFSLNVQPSQVERTVEAESLGTTTVDLGTATVTNAEGAVSLTVSIDNSAPEVVSEGQMLQRSLPLGLSTVVWTAADAVGNIASVTRRILVEDYPPVLTLSASGVLSVTLPMNTPSDTLTTVSIGTATAVDRIDGIVIPTFTFEKDGAAYAPAAGTGVNEFLFPIGLTTVIWTAEDASGNRAVQIQYVSIGTGLALIPPLPKTFEATDRLTVLTDTELGAGEITIQGGTPPYSVPMNNKPAAGFAIGVTPVAWSVSDSVGAQGNAVQSVTVQDTTPPLVTAPANITVTSIGPLTPVNLVPATVVDAVDNPFPATQIFNDAPAGGFPVGTTQVTWTAIDTAGNRSIVAPAAVQIVTVLPPAVACSTLLPEFENSVYPVLNTQGVCQGCHTPENTVSTANGFSLYENDLDADFATFKRISALKDGNGVPVMLVKALGGLAHGGGDRFQGLGANDPDYQLIEDLVNRLNTCVADTVDPSGVDLGSAYHRVRKITLALAGRLPTAAEEAAVEAAVAVDAATLDDALDLVLDQVLTEDAFYQRLKEIYNDVLLTDKYANRTSNPASNFDLRNFANEDHFENSNDSDQRAANNGIAKAPLELIAYVVRNDRPFTEILTADYLMVNPYSAVLFGADVGDASFPYTAGNTNPDDFRLARITDMDALANPHAGVLSTLVFLTRYPSTNTNRNRARARYIFDYFLDTNVEALADRAGLDLDNVVGTFPTLEDPQCTVCHVVMDPVAGLLKNWNNGGRYIGDYTNWYSERNPVQMLPPGYTDEAADELPPGNSGNALQWLAGRIAADNRFALRTVKTLFTGLTGQRPNASATLFLEDVKTQFVSSNYNLKVLIKAIVHSNYFRAANLAPTLDPALFPDIGMGRLLLPEQLHRAIPAVTNGYVWEGPSTRDGLLDVATYMLLYGGIDSDNVINRTTAVTRVMVGIQDRIANQASCVAVAADLNGSRVLFPYVRITDVPDGGAGTASIWQNIQYLHKRLLGEVLPLDDPEIERTYQLFVDVRNLQETSIPGPCRGGGSSTDSNGTVLPWMAVVTYLLSDYKFLHE